MTIDRRKLFSATTLTVLTGGVFGLHGCERQIARSKESRSEVKNASESEAKNKREFDPGLASWDAVRKHFRLNYDNIQMAGHLVTSHPLRVRDALQTYRRHLDRDPTTYLNENNFALEEESRRQAALYLGGESEHIALTDSTTEGIALVYSGLHVKENQEIITTHHDYYSTHKSLEYLKNRRGLNYRQVRLFTDPTELTADELTKNMIAAIQPNTRVIALTWVHSSTGLKFPIEKIATSLQGINARRSEEDRILLCVDAAHGLGVEKETVTDLGADFIMAGGHKWLFGPRGTGIVWGKEDAWQHITPVIPSFSGVLTPGREMTPGGFCAFEHRWALAEAFKFHTDIGRPRITYRIHELNRHCKEELNKMSHVRLVTPMAEELSSGLICFEIDGLEDYEVVDRLAKKGVIASTTPYITSYARLAIGLWNTHEEVDTVLSVIREIR